MPGALLEQCRPPVEQTKLAELAVGFGSVEEQIKVQTSVEKVRVQASRSQQEEQSEQPPQAKEQRARRRRQARLQEQRLEQRRGRRCGCLPLTVEMVGETAKDEQPKRRIMSRAVLANRLATRRGSSTGLGAKMIPTSRTAKGLSCRRELRRSNTRC